jgi:DNA-binding response OmpR family regulator
VELILAHSGADASEKAKRVRPDIGVFDIGMLDLNGYELADRIRLCQLRPFVRSSA